MSQCLKRGIHNHHLAFHHAFTFKGEEDHSGYNTTDTGQSRAIPPRSRSHAAEELPTVLTRESFVTDQANSSSRTEKHPLQDKEQSLE